VINRSLFEPGLVKRSTTVQVADRPGSIREIADVIREHGGRMVSILSSYDNVPEGYRKVYIRMYDIDRPRLQKLQDELIATTRLLYLVDHRENKRVIFNNHR